jgi:BASS family bile acid:Na+ symporter
MSVAINVVLPVLVFLMMIVAGQGITASDAAGILQRKGLVAGSIACQWIVLPAVAGILILGLDLPPVIAGGLILVAAAPVGSIANLYAMLADSNVALSVTLTAASTIAAGAMTPLLAFGGSRLFLKQTLAFEFPVFLVMGQTFAGLIVPALLGALIRHFAPGWTSRWRMFLQRLGLLVLTIVVAFILYDQVAVIRAQIGVLVLTAAAFTAAMLSAGWFFSLLCGTKDRAALLLVFPVRSLGVALLVSVRLLGRLDLASFAAVFLVTQTAILAPLALWWGRNAGRAAAPQRKTA